MPLSLVLQVSVALQELLPLVPPRQVLLPPVLLDLEQWYLEELLLLVLEQWYLEELLLLVLEQWYLEE